MPVVSAPGLPVTEEQRAELCTMARSSLLAQRKVIQAQALLWAADRVANEEVSS